MLFFSNVNVIGSVGEKLKIIFWQMRKLTKFANNGCFGWWSLPPCDCFIVHQPLCLSGGNSIHENFSFNWHRGRWTMRQSPGRGRDQSKYPIFFERGEEFDWHREQTTIILAIFSREPSRTRGPRARTRTQCFVRDWWDWCTVQNFSLFFSSSDFALLWNERISNGIFC